MQNLHELMTPPVTLLFGSMAASQGARGITAESELFLREYSQWSRSLYSKAFIIS